MAIRSCTSFRSIVKVVTPRREMQEIGITTLRMMKFGWRLTHARRWTAQKRRLFVAPTWLGLGLGLGLRLEWVRVRVKGRVKGRIRVRVRVRVEVASRL